MIGIKVKLPIVSLVIFKIENWFSETESTNLIRSMAQSGAETGAWGA